MERTSIIVTLGMSALFRMSSYVGYAAVRCATAITTDITDILPTRAYWTGRTVTERVLFAIAKLLLVSVANCVPEISTFY